MEVFQLFSVSEALLKSGRVYLWFVVQFLHLLRRVRFRGKQEAVVVAFKSRIEN